jgi:hypothetical protein
LRQDSDFEPDSQTARHPSSTTQGVSWIGLGLARQSKVNGIAGEPPARYYSSPEIEPAKPDI